MTFSIIAPGSTAYVLGSPSPLDLDSGITAIWRDLPEEFQKSLLEFVKGDRETPLSEESLTNLAQWCQILEPSLIEFNIFTFYEDVKDIPFDPQFLLLKPLLKDLKEQKTISQLLQKPFPLLYPKSPPPSLDIAPSIKAYLIEKITTIFPRDSLEEFYRAHFPGWHLEDQMVSLSLTYFDFPLNSAPSEIHEIIKEIPLKRGEILSREAFERDALFNYGKEKRDVFTNLWLIIHTNPLFPMEYSAFLENLGREDWFESYREISKVARLNQALLGFLAFLNEDIDKESLFVIQTVLQGFNEIGKDLIVKMLTAEELPVYLTKALFPPYSPNTPPCMLTHRKPKEELVPIKEEIERSFATKLPPQRTAIEYWVDPINTSSLPMPKIQLEHTIIYGSVNSRMGVINERYAVLLPPLFTAELMAKTSSLTPTADPAKHWYSFGYSKSDGTPYFEGMRGISIPSPWFFLPNAHDLPSKAPGLAMRFHDAYHLALDYNNPHRILMAQIAKEFSKRLSTHPKVMQEDLGIIIRKYCTNFAIFLADRETSLYRHLESDKMAFWISLYRFYDRTEAKLILSSREIEERDAWVNTIMIPVIVDTLIREGYSSLLDLNMEGDILKWAKAYFSKLPK